MLYKSGYSIIIFLLLVNIGFAQEIMDDVKIINDTTMVSKTIDPLSPARAAFYSSVLPGLGQAYNKKYWKIPLVYAAIGTGVYFFVDNKNEYERYQTAYKLRISGREDEFNGQNGNPYVSNDGLIRAQTILKKNRDLSLFATIGLYVLNIIEANVDAHLDDKAFSKNLSFRPTIKINPIDYKTEAGISIKFDF